MTHRRWLRTGALDFSVGEWPIWQRAVRGRPEEKEWLVLGIGAAIVLHGAYNFFLSVMGLLS